MARATTTETNLATRPDPGFARRDAAERRSDALARIGALSPRAWGGVVFGLAFLAGLFMVLVLF
ncbi:MAG: hypothetical protein ABI658_27480, partial [Acidimicrobiales bacterium]